MLDIRGGPDLVEEAIQKDHMVLILFTTPGCGVCHAVKEKLELMLPSYPKLKAYHADVAEFRELSGAYSIFSAPVVLVFIDRKETIRMGRSISMRQLTADLNRYYSLYWEG